ncbi:MAG TPA: hypothetical protein VIV60_05280 [Polyangiaceae bacterium]
MARLDVLERIDLMLGALSEDLSPVDRSFGWTEASRNAMHAFFAEMRADVLAGKDVAKIPQYVSVVRGLDHWGISGGRLFEASATIARMVRELK